VVRPGLPGNPPGAVDLNKLVFDDALRGKRHGLEPERLAASVLGGVERNAVVDIPAS